MSRVDQPLLGSLLEQIRGTAGPGGKRMGRTEFGALIDFTPTQVRNIEQGRKLKGDEYDRIVARFPQIEDGSLLIQEVHPVGTAVGQGLEAAARHLQNPQVRHQLESGDVLNAQRTILAATQWTGMRCIQCHAAYRDNGSIQHKSSCPSALARSMPLGQATVDYVQQSTQQPYCTCTDRNAGWTERDGQWVCGSCGKLSKMVFEQQYAVDVPATFIAPPGTFGELVALDEYEEDPELQEAPPKPCPSGVYSQLPIVYVSNSETRTYLRCKRKWYLAWYRQLRLKLQSPTGPLAIGNRVHRALQAWYVPEGENPTDPRAALEVAIWEDWEACKAGFEQRQLSVPDELIREFNDSTSLERAMVEGYVQWLGETGVDSGLRVIASETYVEAPLEVPGAGSEVKLIGKMDVRVRRETDGAKLFIDHKTVGSLVEPLKTIRLDPQMLHYHVLEWLSDVEDGYCDGALYNMLRKVKRTARANPPFFDRVEVHHNRHELEAFKRHLTGIIRSMVDTRTRLDRGEDPSVVAYPSPDKDCAWKCDFLPVCAMHDDGSRVEDLIQQHYEVGDPYSYYRDKEE